MSRAIKSTVPMQFVAKVAKTVYGEDWQSPLSRDAGWSRTTLKRAVKDNAMVPEEVVNRLTAIVYREANKAARQATILFELHDEVKKTGSR